MVRTGMGGNTFRRFDGGSIGVIATDDHSGESCFADEVVVDFPSIASAVDRIRRSFLAEERSTWIGKAIHLSWRDAHKGAVVALDVPVRCTCRRCGGRGETWTEPCAGCAGSGSELRSHQVRVTVPAGVADGARFHFTVAPRHMPPTRIELCVLVS